MPVLKKEHQICSENVVFYEEGGGGGGGGIVGISDIWTLAKLFQKQRMVGMWFVTTASYYW